MRRLCTALLATLLLTGTASPAWADATLFIGNMFQPSSHGTYGAALGLSVLVVGFEFEYANATEDVSQGAPGLRTGTGNVFVQTPVALAGFQPYLTAGVGGYRERLGAARETGATTNAGVGVKVSLAGPVRLRVDYRRLALHGDAIQPRTHRLYLGVSLF